MTALEAKLNSATARALDLQRQVEAAGDKKPTNNDDAGKAKELEIKMRAANERATRAEVGARRVDVGYCHWCRSTHRKERWSWWGGRGGVAIAPDVV